MSAVIYQPVKNPMQSGYANSQHWLLELDRTDSRFIEPVMGWTGSSDTTTQLTLSFATKDEAIAYAKRNEIEYQLLLPKSRKIKPKSYAENFQKR